MCQLIRLIGDGDLGDHRPEKGGAATEEEAPEVPVAAKGG